MKTMYFGNKERMAWVPCPAIDASMTATKWSTSGQYLNGGRYSRSSQTGAMTYQFTWNLTTAQNIRKITDYYDGIYGPGPFYFLDPFALETNVLPSYWAAPRLASDDGPSLVKDTRPTLVSTASNTLSYPTQTAVYTLTEDSRVNELWIPLPPGYVFHLGVHGSATGTAGLSFTPDGGVAVKATMLAVASTQRTNHTVSDATGVTLRLTGVGMVSLAGVMAQIRPAGQTVPAGDFISGQGHSGCAFDGGVPISGYSAALDKKGASATLVEVGAWL